MKRTAKILIRVMGIESSCDDTGVAIISSCGRILADEIFHQHKFHAPFKGIKPNVASEIHETVLPLAVNRALSVAKLQMSDIDVIAATKGPGMVASLRFGYFGARMLAAALNKPFVPVHHMEAHALMPRFFCPEIAYPFLSLLVSGGHTMVVLVMGLGRYRILGNSLDDCIGEAFDKGAVWLGLPWREQKCEGGSAAVVFGGAGSALEDRAKLGDELAFSFPSPLSNSKLKCDFSYSAST